MLRSTVKCVVIAATLGCLAGGCARERRREMMQKAVDLKIQVRQLRQQIDAQESRIEKLESQVAELNKSR